MPLPGPLSFANDQSSVFMVLKALDTLYEANEPTINPLTDLVVSDHEYDLLRKAACAAFPNDPYWKNPTGSDYTPTSTIRLKYPMVSLDKCVGKTRETDFAKWVAHCRKELGNHISFAKSLKIDGTGVAVEYEQGKFVRGGLRPRNGRDAEDRTKNLRMVIGIPEYLSFVHNGITIPFTGTIRGEVYTPKSHLAKVNAALVAQGKEPYANERNYTTGSIRQDDPQITKNRGVHFLAHSIVGLENHQRYYTTDIKRAIWCSKVLKVPHVRVTELDPDNLQELYDLESTVPTNDKLIDGIVVMVDNLEDQEQLGVHGSQETGNPVGKIAWKLPDEEKEGEIKEIVRNVKRTGEITFVGVLKDTLQFNTAVDRVTLHNIGFIRANGITVGSKGIVIKSGGIIPKWVRTTSNKGEYKSDMTCPVCRHQTSILPGGTDKYREVCANRQCPGQLLWSLLHYLQVLGVKGIGDSIMAKLVETGLVKTPADFYRLNVPALTSAGLSERQALLALAAIHMVPDPSKQKDNGVLSRTISDAMGTKKKIPLWMVFASQGIEGAGKTAGKVLGEVFADFAKIRAATIDELEDVEGIGDITAPSIRAFFEENSAMLDDLLQYIEPELPNVNGPLAGMTFVLSGSMDPYSKADLELEITAKSGKVGGSVSKKMVPIPGEKVVAYLVAGPGSESKSVKAKELGVPIIDVAGLKAILNLG